MISKIKLSKLSAIGLIILLSLFLFAISCGTGNVTNNNPTISLSVDRSTVTKDGKVIFTATVADADNDTLTVTWSANNGSLNQYTGLIVTWTAPSSGGTYNISATVTDGHGGSATDNKFIKVNSDDIPPTNTTDNNFINNGAATTSSKIVTLSISATDNTGITGYYISENSNIPSASASEWTSVIVTANYSANISFTLSSEDGTKTIYVWFKDAVGNISTHTSGNIKLITEGNSDSTNITNGLVAYYPFNGNANDESGNGNNGTVYGATLTADRLGNTNNAYSFNGLNDYINIGNNSILTTLTPKSITISAWIYNKQIIKSGQKVIDKRDIVSQREGDSGYGLSYGFADIWMDYGYFVDITFWNGYGAYIGYEIKPNKWYHIVGTLSNNKGKIYINGEEQALILNDGRTGYTNTPGDVMIGRHGNYNSRLDYHNGIIDDIRIYNRSLSESEIQALYSN